MNAISKNLAGSPARLDAVIRLGNEVNNSEAKFVGELLQEGVTPDAKQVRKLVEYVAKDSIAKDATLPGIVRTIAAIEGRGSDYYTSQEAIDTANAVLRMANGTATKSDYALIERSEGARTVVLASEGTDAWNSLKAEADKRVRSDATSSTAKAVPLPLEGEGSGVKYKGDEHAVVKDGDVFTKDGRKVTISAKADTVNGIVVNGESKRFQKNDSKGYSVAEKLATSFKKPVKFVKGLYDAEGNMLDGAETDSGIFINTEAKNPIKWAATHEFSHTMKKRAGEAWSAYQKFVINKLKKDGTYYKVFDTKAKAYGTRDAAYINEEIACDYIGETFDSVDELADLIRKDRGLAVKVRDFYYKALDKLGLLDEKKKAQRMWASAYREAMKNSDVKYEDGAHQSKSGTRVDNPQDVIDLSENNELTEKIKGLQGSEKYKAIRDFILEELNNYEIIFNDGIKAVVDKSDALHIANKSANKKTSYIAKIKEVIEKAELYAIADKVEHKKFDEFRYYKATVKLNNEVYDIYLNVGRSKNGDGYHLYDITKKIGGIVKQNNALERVNNDLRSETNSPTETSVSQNSPSVKGKKSVSGTRVGENSGLQRDDSSDKMKVNNNLSESGEKNENTGNNDGRTGEVPKRIGSQRGRNSGNTGDISVGDSTLGDERRNRGVDEKGRPISQKRSEESLDMDAQGSKGENASSRRRTDGERFLEAIKSGDEALASTRLSMNLKKTTIKQLRLTKSLPATISENCLKAKRS